MSFIKTFFRRALARCGYELAKSDRNRPPTVEAYLRELRTREPAELHVICLDNELSIQSQLLKVFSESHVTFSCPSSSRGSEGKNGSIFPAKRFVAVVDIDSLPIVQWEGEYPWLKSAEVILVCSRFGSFWRGRQDLVHLSGELHGWGYSLTDVLGGGQLSLPQSPAELLVLAFECSAASRVAFKSGRFRVLEALTYLSAPIVGPNDFQVLAGRGTEGFCGVLNPGGILNNGSMVLLARGETFSWAAQKLDESKLLASVQPVVIHRASAQTPFQTKVLPPLRPPGTMTARTEDFRLFRFRGEVFSNHPVMVGPSSTPRTGHPVRLEHITSRIGLSRLDVDPFRLEWIGYPELGRPLARVEKNWVMFTEGERLFLLYSMSPYVLFECRDWNDLRFEVIIDESLALPFSGDGLSIRNSVNPVPYDADHWLHVVHRVYPNKQYTYWAVLIDRRTLRPVRVSSRPLVHGGASYPASIIYVCAVMAGADDITLASGIDDAATAITTFPRARLDREWVPIS